MVGLRPDVRYALRAGARSPLPTLVAAISLELAIGANSTNLVRPGYFQTVGIPLLRGPDFTAGDDAGSAPVVMVNRALASRYFPGDALGRTLRIQIRSGAVREATVVGVTATTKVGTLGEAPRPFFYLPASQLYRPDMVLFARGDAATGPLPASVGEAAASVDPEVPVRVCPMVEDIAFSPTPARILSWVLGVVGSVGLLLAAVGLFGLVSYTTARRTRELGIRMALGARGGAVRIMVLLAGARLTALGLTLGCAAAALASGVLHSFLFGVSRWDPVSFGLVVAILLTVTAAATWAPARNAARLDPAEVLRE